MRTRSRRIAAAGLAAAALAVAVAPPVLAASASTSASTAAASQCRKFSGTVVLTYSNPDTIILHVIKGKVNAATTFTMTPTTTYLRNGAPATFADVRIGDTGTIAAQEQLRSGILLAC